MNKLTDILDKLVYTDGHINIIKYCDDNNYKAVLRLKLQGKSDEESNSKDFNMRCNEWVTYFSNLTKTQWVVKLTLPNLQKLLFRKKYVCHHSNFNKVREDKRTRESTRKKGKLCGASIDIKIKKINRNTIRNDVFLKKGLSAEITITFKHSHLVHVAEAYSYLKMSDDTKEQFIDYFNEGMTPSAAKNFHELNLINGGIDDATITKLLADSQVNPKDREIYSLFDEWRQDKYGDRNLKSMISILQDKKTAYEEQGVSIYIHEDPLAVLILTPIMKRSHEQKFSNEICFVDSSGSCDQMSTVITFIIGVSKVGGIPLACLLHTAQTQDNYSLIFKILKQHTPHGFGGDGEPKIFMTDDSSAERNALKEIYPKATLLLCTFHICQAVWRWLWDSKNRIDKDKRRKLMMEFRCIIFAQTEEECEEYFLSLTEKCEYDSFKKYVRCLWERKVEWCHWYRKSLCTRGHNTNNFVEASIRVIKDIVLARCKAFNAVALLNFIVNILEKYHKRRLICYASSRHSENDVHYLKLTKRTKNLEVKQMDEGAYLVSSSTDPQLFYTVLIDGSLCDCASGAGGAFCKHLCSVQNYSGVHMLTCPLLTENDKQVIAYIATGDKNNAFFKSMLHEPNEPIELKNQKTNANEAPHSTPEVAMELEYTNRAPNEEHKKAVECLKSEFNRISNLAENETCNTDLIKRFTRTLQKINTGSQLGMFLAAKRPIIKQGKIIKVQPTARSRRNSRLGSKLGAKRLQSGRPAKKRKHSLARNILSNIPNAKIH